MQKFSHDVGRLLLGWAPLVLALTNSAAVYAQQPTSAFDPKDYAVSVDGRKSPADIPRELIMEAFFTYYASGLALKAPDQEVVSRFSRLHTEQKAKNRTLVEAKFQEACAAYVVGSGVAEQNVYPFMNEIASLRTTELATMAELYAQFLAALSTEARSLVTGIVSNNIAPGVRHVEVDLPRLAAAVIAQPEISSPLLGQLRRGCQTGLPGGGSPAGQVSQGANSGGLGTLGSAE